MRRDRALVGVLPDLELVAAADEPNPSASQLWNAMIHPLINMTFRGATWYQGEANAGDPPSYAAAPPRLSLAVATAWTWMRMRVRTA